MCICFEISCSLTCIVFCWKIQLYKLCIVHVSLQFTHLRWDQLTVGFISLFLLYRCDIHPYGLPQFNPDCVGGRSLKASCPFKSFLSITQQVQWCTSNKQPQKRKLTGLGGASQAKEPDTYGETGPLIRAVTVATMQTHTHTHTHSPTQTALTKANLGLVHLKPDNDKLGPWRFCPSFYCEIRSKLYDLSWGLISQIFLLSVLRQVVFIIINMKADCVWVWVFWSKTMNC